MNFFSDVVKIAIFDVIPIKKDSRRLIHQQRNRQRVCATTVYFAQVVFIII
jgi:hypothetical protein